MTKSAIVENCEGNASVTREDISNTVKGKLDNDFRCPIVGKNVSIVYSNGQYYCVLPDGVSCSYWQENPEAQSASY